MRGKQLCNGAACCSELTVSLHQRNMVLEGETSDLRGKLRVQSEASKVGKNKLIVCRMMGV